jgi:alkaline phosphatase
MPAWFVSTTNIFVLLGGGENLFKKNHKRRTFSKQETIALAAAVLCGDLHLHWRQA